MKKETHLTSFGKTLRKIRIDKEVTITSLAEKVQISALNISGMETGHKPVTASLINQLKNTLSLSNDETASLIHAAAQDVKPVSLTPTTPEEAETSLLLSMAFINGDHTALKRVAQALRA